MGIKKAGYIHPPTLEVTKPKFGLLRSFQMSYSFCGGLFRQIGMLHLAVIDSIIQARDAGIQVFISGFGMGLRSLRMFGDSLCIVGFSRGFRVLKRFRHVAFPGISAKRR
jgi:hypothetical protein